MGGARLRIALRAVCGLRPRHLKYNFGLETSRETDHGATGVELDDLESQRACIGARSYGWRIRAMWVGDPLKLAMRHFAQLFNRLSINVSESSSVVSHAPSPKYRREFLRRLGLNIYGRSLGIVGRAVLGPPTLVTDTDWDSLILLDACRYDALAEVWSAYGLMPAKLPAVASPGTTTLLWIKENFVRNANKGRMGDVTVIAGNPYISETYFRLRRWDYPFKKAVNVWKEGWEHSVEGVPPEEVYNAARQVEGRLLVHFLQPHSPFIRHPEVTWAKIEAGEVTLEEAREAYEDNLRLVLEWALRLVSSLEGKVVLTSDHGELFGEYGLYGHPHKVYVPELVTVPWIELEGGPPALSDQRER